MKHFAIAAVVAATVSAAAVAQSAPPAASPPPAAPAAPAPSTPRVDCRAQAQSKGLRGQDMRDAMAICVEELRLACVKEAVAKRIVGSARRDFVRNCAGRPPRDEKS